MGSAKGKVMVGMSGGVDSSVTALLLIEQGFEVVGVTLKLWDSDEEYSTCAPAEKICCSLKDIEDARFVAAKLGIPHYVLNFKDLFKEKVVDYFVSEYAQARTPNPCIACNRHIKMSGMLEKAMTMGFDYIATGHYARIEKNESAGRFELLKGKFTEKDQSYVLYNFTQHQLERTLMPLGGMSKPEVRELAVKHDLINAKKPDSQEICFVTDDDYASFVEKFGGVTSVPGNFVYVDGRVLGRHKGIVHYTVGQRKGLGIAHEHPLFVVRLDKEKNEVVLGPESAVFGKTLVAKDLNFISIDRLVEPIRAQIKIRYSARQSWGTVSPIDDDCVLVVFDEPQRAITAGQAVVFYDGDKVIGGGTISDN